MKLRKDSCAVQSNNQPRFRVFSSASRYSFHENVSIQSLLKFLDIPESEVTALYGCEMGDEIIYNLKFDNSYNVIVKRIG